MAKTSVRAGDLGGFEIAYDWHFAGGASGGGEGAKTALLLHGWGANRAAMGVFARIFTELGWEVCALDLPGFGASSEPAQAMDFRAYARVVAAFCAAKGLAPAAVVGHSFGCKVAAALLAECAHIYKEKARANNENKLTIANEAPCGAREASDNFSSTDERIAKSRVFETTDRSAESPENRTAKSRVLGSDATSERTAKSRVPGDVAESAERSAKSPFESGAPLLILAGAAGVPRPKPLAVRAKIALAKLFRGAKFASKMRAKDAANLSAVMYESFKIAVNDDARASYAAAARAISPSASAPDSTAAAPAASTPAAPSAPTTLILAGQSDTATPLDTARELAALMENSALVEFAGGHFFYADAANRERLAAVIKQFINER